VAGGVSREVEGAMRGRRSVRAFLPTPVPQATVAEILALAACAPSGTNIQPWHVIALAGEERERVCERAQHAFHHEQGLHLHQSRRCLSTQALSAGSLTQRKLRSAIEKRNKPPYCSVHPSRI